VKHLLVISVVMTATLVSGGQALAGPEWCDDGSPPSNDFRHRPTGAGSGGSSLGWLSSATGGELDLAAGVNTLEGGVAHGMAMALLHARPFATLPHADRID
jgi:hypothetical protein